MGLDNGINFKVLNKDKFGEIPAWFRREPWEDEHNRDYEILYWRKCWNVRSSILCSLPDTHGGGGEFPVTPDQLQNIFEILKALYTKKNWDEHESIWSWDEIKKDYPANLRYAKRVAKWLASKPVDSFEIYFYDSY